MRKTLKQLLSLNMVLVMLLSMIPVTVASATTEPEELPEKWLRVDGVYYDWDVSSGTSSWSYYAGSGYLQLNNYGGGSIATNQENLTINGSGIIVGEDGVPAIECINLSVGQHQVNTSLTLIGGSDAPAVQADRLNVDVQYHEYIFQSGGASVPAINCDDIEMSQLSVTATMKAGNTEEESASVLSYGGEPYFYLYQNGYRHRFIDRGVVVGTQDVTWEDITTEAPWNCPEIERDGYWLVGWQTSPGDVFDDQEDLIHPSFRPYATYGQDDVDYYAKWEEANDGTVLLYNVSKVITDTTTVCHEYLQTDDLSADNSHGFAPIHAGMYFAGWYLMGDSTETPVDELELGKKYCTLWEHGKVTYHLSDGSTVQLEVNKPMSTDTTIPAGALFIGWNTASDGSGRWHLADYGLLGVPDGTDLYSHYIENPEEKILLYINATSSSVSLPKYKGYPIGTPLNLPSRLDNSDVFAWIECENNLIYQAGAQYTFDQHIIFAPAFLNSTFGNNFYTLGGLYWPDSWQTGGHIAYMSNGGETNSNAIGVFCDFTAVSDSNLTLYGDDTFTHDDKVFVEWNTKADGTGISYKAGQNVGVGWAFEPEVLYAIWKDSSNDGESVPPVTPPVIPPTVIIPNGGNSGNSGNSTVTKPDGSIVTTERDNTGSKSETIVDKNGIQTTEVTVTNTAVRDAVAAGESVVLPMPAATATKDIATAPTVTVDLPANVKTAKVEIPVENTTAGTVAIIVHADGTEEIVRNCVPTENGIALNVADGATVKIVDNSREFGDVAANHTFNEAIDFASARGIIEGYGNGNFAPGNLATSAAVVTVVARIMGEDFYGNGSTIKAQDWAKENGIAVGLDLSGNITRGAFMTMLWRAAGCPTSTTVVDFADASRLNDIEKAAFAWAVENGVINGYGDGTVRPKAGITRGAMAAIAQRYMTRK